MAVRNRYWWMAIAASSIACLMASIGYAAEPRYYFHDRCVAYDINPTWYATELLSGRIGPPSPAYAPIVVFDSIIRRHDQDPDYNYWPREDLIMGPIFGGEEPASIYPFAHDGTIIAECQDAAAEAAFAKIENELSDDSWRALQFLAFQNDDEDLAYSAVVIAARLDRARFERMASEAKKAYPTKNWIFDEVRKYWWRPSHT